MRVLIDIGHPAHVHLYRNLYLLLTKSGHDVFVTVKNIPSAIELLQKFGIIYYEIGDRKDSMVGKIISQIHHNVLLYKFIKRKKINLAFGSSMTIVHISKISSMKSVVFDDDDDNVQPLFVKFAHPYCNSLVSPDALRGTRNRKDTVLYPGYHELAYLHPKRFQPDLSVLADVGINEGDPFFIMRFNVFKAHHDVGIKGLTLEQKIRLTELLKPHGKIFITTERDIEPELKQYQMKVPPEKVHSLMAYATMFIGDSQTMTSEAAVMGVPAVKCNSFAGRLSVPNELEKRYKLCYSYLPENFEEMMKKIQSLLVQDDLLLYWQNLRDEMLKDKIDVTAFWFWLINEYPASLRQIEDSPSFWAKFR